MVDGGGLMELKGDAELKGIESANLSLKAVVRGKVPHGLKPGAFRLSRFPCGRTPSPGPVLRPPYSRPKPGLAAGLCFGAPHGVS